VPRTDSLDSCSVKVVHAARVRSARARRSPPSEIERICALFRLLGDPTRMRILEALLLGDEFCVCDLAATVGALETTVSQSLRLLRAAGLVRARREGRMVFYTLSDATVRRLLEDTRAGALAEAPDAGVRRPARGAR
jgi:ArsR family transcriptional regulator, lead/cadmium/zinc/bismuth-responsive transcriptional repressor